MKRLLFLLLSTLILVSGCASQTLVEKSATNASIADSEMAYVLTGYDGYTYSEWTHTSRRFDEKANKYEKVEFDASVFSGTTYCFLLLQPGTYSMTWFSQYVGNTQYYMNDTAQNMNELLKNNGGLMGSFTVEKGKITYIGDMNLSMNNYTKRFDLSVKDNQKAALEFLQKEYPGINAAGLLKVNLTKRGPGAQ